MIPQPRTTLNDLRAEKESRRVEAEAAEAAANLQRFEQLPKYVEGRRPETPKCEKNFILENKWAMECSRTSEQGNVREHVSNGMFENK